MKGLLELESGWWVFVGALRERQLSPTVVMFLHYDPKGEGAFRVDAAGSVRMTRSEALWLSAELTDAAKDDSPE